ncbi:hypothetical protein [Larkinella arboricola]
MFPTSSYRLPQPITVGRIFNVAIESELIKVGYIFVLALLSFPYFDFAHTPSAGIDNSWRMALEIIYEKKLVWGKDVIYTYGPLGRWLQRYVITTAPFELFLVDSFVAINLVVLLYSFLPNPLKLWHLLLYFPLWAIVNSMHGEWIHFLWFYLVIYWGVRYLYQPNLLLLYYLLVLSAVNFFMKANYGIIILGYTASLLSFRFVVQRGNVKEYLASLTVLGLLLITGAYWLHTDLIGYLISSLHVIDGYNESQALYPENKLRVVLLAYGCFLLQFLTAIVYLVRLRFAPQKRNDSPYITLFTLFWLLIISFVLLKYAFTRADDGHLTVFIKQSSLLLLLVMVSVPEAWLKKTFFGYLVLNCVIYLTFYIPIFGKIPVNYTTEFSQKALLVRHYLQQAVTHSYPVPQATLPDSIRQKIGRQTVDVIPNEISTVYFNGLNYNPRPALQSYQAYNAYLDAKNRDKYLSDSAPEWVIFEYTGIDGKYPLADETQTLLALLQRYSTVDESNQQLFLRKNRQTKQLTLVRQQTKRIVMGQKLHLATTDSLLHVVYARTQYTAYGKALNLFFQPPQLTMTIRAEDDSAVEYRAVPSLLQKGVIVTSRVDNLADAKEFLATQQVTHKHITDISFDQKIRWQPGFDPAIDLIIQSYRLK